MELVYFQEAEKELLDSVAYLEEKSTGLGTEFLDEFDTAIQTIVNYPDSGSLVSPVARRILLNRF